MSSRDLEFLKHTRLLAALPPEAVGPMLDCFTYREVKTGQRFIRQGEPGETCFVVQRGTCTVRVEKSGQLHTVGRIGAGEIVGEMAILTGEPRSAHVDADSAMQLWSLERAQFERLAAIHPELRIFLTEILADRLSTRKLTAERTIGKYLVTDIVGRGGYSLVYKGVHTGLDMPVAVKMMKHDMAMNDEFLAKFHQEARTIAAFNHENIIKVYDIEARFRTVFIIMEMVEGQTIRDMIRQQKSLAFDRIADLLVQVCEGLAYAHRRGIVHRDVKPSNMFVCRDGRLKILDFGLACPTGTENLDFSGSIPYMSPEEIEGEAVDQRTDLYSLGIMAYEMVTGQRPFPEQDLVALMDMHLSQDVPDPAKIRPDVPDRLRTLILKACARNPEHRYPDVELVLEALQQLSRDLGLSPKSLFTKGRRMATLQLAYREDQRMAVIKLIDDFSRKICKVGADLEVVDFEEN